ncbi:helix-turn-helix domain-containing protein [Streptomyces sp. NPDC088729]|uniref:helix-turn-helix domain-containing protein n=1 Tax=Streptomyces sp. NPDC088729 TaxID=3365876 RepID=UPI0037FB69DE
MANTNDGLASARARGRVGGRRPKLTADQAELAQQLYDAREKTVQQIADMFNVPRSTVYGHLDKTKTVPRQPKKPWSRSPNRSFAAGDSILTGTPTCGSRAPHPSWVGRPASAPDRVRTGAACRPRCRASRCSPGPGSRCRDPSRAPGPAA